MIPRVNFSGYQYQSVLLSVNDLKKVLDLFEPVSFFNVSSVQTQDQTGLDKASFLRFYEHYLNDLFAEQPLDIAAINFHFSHALATSIDCFFKQEFSEGRFLLKPKRSVLQMQPLGLFVSSIDHKVHIKSFAKDALSFGIKFNFPTIFEDTSQHLIHELETSDPEYARYILLRQFIRHHTKPVILEHADEKNVYPFRYSDDLKEKICNLSFFAKNGLKVSV